MKIDSSHSELTASRVSWQQQLVPRENARTGPGPRLPDRGPRPTKVSISEAGQAAAAADSAALDPRWQLLRSMLQLMFGENVPLPRLRDADAAEIDAAPADAATEAAVEQPVAPSPAPPEAARVVEQARIDFESLSVQAKGVVRTADGREIRFELQLQLAHLEIEWSRTQQAAAQDPLVLNFDGPLAQLSGQRWDFDLDGDGQAEHLPGLPSGSGWLVFDRNHDGVANDGSELFGPRSGDGFGELAQLDADGNGWIDENDPSWSDLRVWRHRAGLQTLAEADVGAISLARLSTPFGLHDNNGLHLGQLRQSGFYLHEDGTPGGVQQVDLNV